MAEEAKGANGAASPAPQAAPPKMQIVNQYVRDLSFENIAAQKGMATEGKPEVKVQVNLDARKQSETNYEVALKIRIDSRVGEAPLFLLELDYAGRFNVENVPAEQLHPLLMIEGPRLIFPFVRRVISDVTRDGGYPPVNLDTIDFLALYRQELARRRQAQQQENEAAPQQA